MQFLMLGTIVVVMVTSFVVTSLHLPSVLKLVPELMTALAVPYIIAAGSQQRFQFVNSKYWVMFGIALFFMVCGIVVNDVDSGPAIAGMRAYLRAMPFFLVAATYAFSPDQIKTQLRLLLGLALLQLPFAGYQRWQLWRQGRFTGDYVFGTVGDSGILSLFLIASVCVATALMLRRYMTKTAYALLFFLLLAPTSINETKVTIVLLPLALLVVLIVGGTPGKRLRVLAGATAMLAVFGALFVPVYDLMQTKNPYKKDITTFFTDKKELNRYLKAKHAGVGSVNEVGRGDALRIPLQYLSSDPVKLAFGLGIGNASDSSLGKNFSGRYDEIFQRIRITSFSTFTLELGVLGTVLIFVLYWMIFRDALFVARNDDGLYGALGVGWTAVTVIMAIGTIYTNIHVFESLSFLFWYFSGVMAARRMHLVSMPAVPEANSQLASGRGGLQDGHLIGA